MIDDRLRAVLSTTSPVLLDFDGPVTRLLPAGLNAEIAEVARDQLVAASYELPQDLATSTDHIALLRFSAGVDPATRQKIESTCRELEVHAAHNSEPTPGAAEFLEACQTVSRSVAIASNNDTDAIETYLHRLGLRHLVTGVVGRPRGHPELMKPDTLIILAALKVLEAQPQRAVMIGDAVSDVIASHGAGVRIIGFAKHANREIELADAGADALVRSIEELVDSLTP